MAARPFRRPRSLPEPLTVEETRVKFGVSPAVVRAAQRVLVNGDSVHGKSRKSGTPFEKKSGRRQSPAKSKGRIA